MRIHFHGDYHGPDGYMQGQKWAQQMGADLIIQVGDFWAYDGGRGQTVPADWYPVPVHFIAGNHEKARVLNKDKKHAPTIKYMRDYTAMEIGGLVFGFIGRIQKSKNHVMMINDGWDIGQTLEHRIWLRESESALEAMGEVDILVTHDMPWPERNDFLTQTIHQLRPSYAVHGHMHQTMRRLIDHDDGTRFYTTVDGLAPCDPYSFPGVRDVVMLDTETRTLARDCEMKTLLVPEMVR